MQACCLLCRPELQRAVGALDGFLERDLDARMLAIGGALLEAFSTSLASPTFLKRASPSASLLTSG